ncbi:MAG TPA: sigma-70 family RNA polymerase sigma factor [Polyangiaceae bacterium]
MTREVAEARVLMARAERGPTEVRALARARGRLQRARAELVRANTYLVVAIARRHRRPGVELADLVQDGSIGLLRAVEKFDASLGHRFGVYAVWWIRQQMFRGLAEHGRTIRVPLPALEANRRVGRARRVFVGRYGREPEPSELANECGMSSDAVVSAVMLIDEPVSLHGRLGDGDQELIEVVEDRATTPPDEEFASHRLHARLRALLAALEPRERTVMSLRFGLDGEREHGLHEIAEKLGLSRERVRRIEARALSKLRGWSVRGGLADYLAA